MKKRAVVAMPAMTWALMACSVGDLPAGPGSPTDAASDASSDASFDGAPGATRDGSSDRASDGTSDGAPDGPSDAGAVAPPSLCPYSDWTGDACAPVCGSGGFGDGGLVDGAPFGLPNIVAGLSEDGVPNYVTGVSASGAVLHVRGVNGTQFALLLSVPSPSSSNGYLTYTLADSSVQPALPFDVLTVRLTFDGESVYMTDTAHSSFLIAPLVAMTIGTPAPGPFAALNEGNPPGATLGTRTLSADGLNLYYAMSNMPDPAENGMYVATRTDASAPFSAATRLPGTIQALDLNSVSSDDLTGFFTDPSFNMHVVSRTSTSEPWVSPDVMPDGAVVGGLLDFYGAQPTADCRFVFADCSPGGVTQTHICLLPRQP
jgi:hypothetical protein